MNDRIGSYQIERELGRGGMGVVYLATDERLGRQVAIKALPPELAEDPSRLERFEREARTLATLNHPNLAGIYGVEEQEGSKYLILEYVEGETLEDRLNRGPLPLDDALELAVQIAAGVEAAHEAGVVHRDLKPANIIITPDGVAKVLDFGLARVDEPGSSSTGAVNQDADTLAATRSPPPSPQNSPTIAGAILGTAAYMSPEQARGRRVDKRSDIWSFGVVLYEMLAGQSPFRGETASDSIGAVLHKGLDFNALPPNTPPSVRRVLARCLERDKNQRYRDIGDVRLELLTQNPYERDEASTAAKRRGIPAWAALTLAVACALAAFALARLVLNSGPPPDTTPRAPLVVDIAAPDGYLIERRSGRPLFSPDGRKILLVVRPTPIAPGESPGVRVPCIIDMTTGASTIFAQFPDATYPLWSPDGTRFLVGTFGDDGFKVVVADATSGRVEMSFPGDTSRVPMGLDWCADGSLLLAVRSLERVNLSTGEVVETLPFKNDADPGGSYPAWPHMLPDGVHYLYTMLLAGPDAGLYLGSTADGTQRRLLPNEAVRAIYREASDGPHGWLYWSLEDAIFRQRLNLEAGELIDTRETVAEGVWGAQWPYYTPFDVAADGRLVYGSEQASPYENELVRVDLETKEESSMGIFGSLWNPMLSSDDRLLLLDITTDANLGDIFIVEPARGNLRTLISGDRTNETFPIWVGRDDNRIVFSHDGDLFIASRDGREPPRLISDDWGATVQALTTTPNGKTALLVARWEKAGVKLLDLETETLRDWLDLSVIDARITPDGAWVALSTRSVINQLELRRFPEGTNRIVVDSGDIAAIELSKDGRRLFYIKDADLFRVALEWDAPDARPAVGVPERLFSIRGRHYREFDVNADGTELLAVKVLERRVGSSIRLSVPGE
jgi:serine/threonine protein kinase/Tol biopolymer transport system component